MKITINDYGNQTEFMVINNSGKQFCFMSAQFYQDSSWVATISTQKGCPMKCQFCDCPTYGFHGNASIEDLQFEIEHMLSYFVDNYNIKSTNRFNVHFARMGEPTFNTNVLSFTQDHLKPLVQKYIQAKTIHPVVSTMLPKHNQSLKSFLTAWTHDIKNNIYQGEAGLQFSINSTDNKQRAEQFNSMSLSLEDISDLSKLLPKPVGRKYTLNFAVTKDTILDPTILDQLFNKDHFIVKITPIHQTYNAIKNNYDISTTYIDYDVYKQFEQPLLEHGWQVIVFVPSLEEDQDRITCGNALISHK